MHVSRTSVRCSSVSTADVLGDRDARPDRTRRADVAAGQGELERGLFDREQLAGRVPRRPAGRLARLGTSTPGKQRELLGRLEHLLDVAPCAERPATAQTSSGS